MGSMTTCTSSTFARAGFEGLAHISPSFAASTGFCSHLAMSAPTAYVTTPTMLQVLRGMPPTRPSARTGRQSPTAGVWPRCPALPVQTSRCKQPPQGRDKGFASSIAACWGLLARATSIAAIARRIDRPPSIASHSATLVGSHQFGGDVLLDGEQRLKGRSSPALCKHHRDRDLP